MKHAGNLEVTKSKQSRFKVKHEDLKYRLQFDILTRWIAAQTSHVVAPIILPTGKSTRWLE